MDDLNKALSDRELEQSVGGVAEIVEPLLEGCEFWQCKKCGHCALTNGYHSCGFSITKAVCEYCRFFSCGKCGLNSSADNKF